jgi:hypothetical protein
VRKRAVRVAAEVKVAAVVAHLADDLGQHAAGAGVTPLRVAAELAHADQPEQVTTQEGHLIRFHHHQLVVPLLGHRPSL